MRRALLLGLLAAAAAATPARASLTAEQIAAAGATPPPGASLPATLAFVDQAGRRMPLGRAAAGRPTLLLFADYTCRNVCGPGLSLTVAMLREARLEIGRDVSLLVIGLDPRDGPAAARAMAAARLRGADAAAPIALLSGSGQAVAAIERALGYHAVYDPQADQFAHDAALYVFARDGRLSALLPEIGTSSASLRAAVEGPARTAPPTSFAERALALCHGFIAAQGPYAGAIQTALQAGGLILIAAFGVFLLRPRRR